MWAIRSVGYQENFTGEVEQPTELYFSDNLIFYFSSMRKEDKGDFAGWIRAYKEEPLVGLIFSKKLSFDYGEYLRLSMELEVPFKIEIKLRLPAIIQRYQYFIFEQKIKLKTNILQVNLTVDEKTEILGANVNRKSIFIENRGMSTVMLSFGGEIFDIELQPRYAASFEPGTIDSVWGLALNATTVKVTEVTAT